MASTDTIIRNGFPCVTRANVTDHGHLMMEHAENMRSLFQAIERLGEADKAISGLAALGKSFADMAHNDADVIREQAEKAGVVGELVPVKA